MAGNWIEVIELLRTELVEVETDVSTLKQLMLSWAESVDEIERNQIQRFTSMFSEDGTKIKELISELAAVKEKLRTESQTFEHKNKMLKILRYLKQLIPEMKELFQKMKQLVEKRKMSQTNAIIFTTFLMKLKGLIAKYSTLCDYIDHFSYGTKEINSKVVDSLWHEIHLSTNEAKIRDENPNRYKWYI